MTNETEGEMEHNLTLARNTAVEFSELFRKRNIASYEEFSKSDLVLTSQAIRETTSKKK